MVINGRITIGTLTAAFIYLMRLQFPMAGLGWVANLLQRSNAALDRIIKLKSEFIQGDWRRAVSPTPLPKTVQTAGGLTLKGLNFHYPEGAGVLNNIHLEIPAGSSLGIAGPVGCGKTTLVHLLCGVYTPPPGQLFLDGRPRESFSEREWQRHFSLAPQDGFLFSQSIRENILMGAGTAHTLTVEKAGEYSGFARDLPQITGGYNALLGERGINLSGGQRQRVGLARALMAEAAIYCLDDTLSALDAEMEAFVLQHMIKILAGKTRIIVSHRYSALSRCDHILFLDRGGIAEQGTHQALLAAKGKYARIYEKQILSSDLEKA
jgi:ABC-type multidrug transport system fused ATPase/permease subunit